MKITLVLVEDALISAGFRRMAASAAELHSETRVAYVSTGNWRTIGRILRGDSGGGAALEDQRVEAIAAGLVGADLVGFSAMTGYAQLTKRVIARLRHLSPGTYVVWGGIHPIMHPEDAIATPGVDAICTGEGEFAWAQFFEAWRNGRDASATPNFWFRRGDGEVVRNGFLPLQTPAEMETLPLPRYGEGEEIFEDGRGFVPLTRAHYVASDGLGYNTIWSIGCPFRCNYCGNTAFLANDAKYAKIRHPSPDKVIAEVKAARAKHPHLSTVNFHDDSFLAIPYPQIAAFAERWQAELGDLPFAVYGVIPNYVRRDKLEVLTWAGMNRVRMGIQSGSQRILEFYDRPTPVPKIEDAADVLASFAPRYHIPPAYDLILDNPLETREDVVATLELMYRMRRPYTVNPFSLRVIPNSHLETALRERGVEVAGIEASYGRVSARWANVVMYVLAIGRPPRAIFEWLLRDVRATAEPQPLYPAAAMALRALFMLKRGSDHLRFMDFSIISGRTGYVLWRTGVVGLWRALFTRRHQRPDGPRRPSGPPPAHDPYEPETWSEPARA